MATFASAGLLGVPSVSSIALSGARRAICPPPLTADDATGRVALVPRSRYPNESCSEHDGRGWEVLIISATSQTAVVRFLFARTARGQRYEDTREPLHLLEPLS